MANPDLQTLLDALLPSAQSMVKEHGSFPPFGAMILLDGEVQRVGTDPGEEPSSAEALIDRMTETFKGKAAADEIRAAVTCYDGFTIPPGQSAKVDALCFNLEHRSGDAMNVFFPYVRKPAGDVQYGQVFAVERVPQFFA